MKQNERYRDAFNEKLSSGTIRPLTEHKNAKTANIIFKVKKPFRFLRRSKNKDKIS